MFALVLFGGLSISGCPKSHASEPEKKPSYPPTLSGGRRGFVPRAGKAVVENRDPPANEPGEPLVITGKVFRSDGKTPAEGTVLWVLSHGPDGYYNAQDDASHPRLNGWMKIGPDGNTNSGRSGRARIRTAVRRRTFMRTFTDRDFRSARLMITGSKTIRGLTIRS